MEKRKYKRLHYEDRQTIEAMSKQGSSVKDIAEALGTHRDIWNMAHVEDGEKYYIRKEYTEVSELHKGSEQPVIIQQVPQQTEPAAGEEPQNGQEEKEGVNNAS